VETSPAPLPPQSPLAMGLQRLKLLRRQLRPVLQRKLLDQTVQPGRDIRHKVQ
jgi:hypothetical protein